MTARNSSTGSEKDDLSSHLFGHFRPVLAILFLSVPLFAGFLVAFLLARLIELLGAKIHVVGGNVAIELLECVVLYGLTILLSTNVWKFPARMLRIGPSAWRFLVWVAFGVGLFAGFYVTFFP